MFNSIQWSDCMLYTWPLEDIRIASSSEHITSWVKIVCKEKTDVRHLAGKLLGELMWVENWVLFNRCSDIIYMKRNASPRKFEMKTNIRQFSAKWVNYSYARMLESWCKSGCNERVKWNCQDIIRKRVNYSTFHMPHMRTVLNWKLSKDNTKVACYWKPTEFAHFHVARCDFGKLSNVRVIFFDFNWKTHNKH